MIRVAGAVLTGGGSRRMGRPKALVEVAGVPMAVRVAGALAAAGCDPVVFAGGDEVLLGPLGFRVVPDGPSATGHAQGPLAGVIAALEALTGTADVVVTAACDLALLDETSVRAVVAAVGSDAAAAVAATLRVEPALAAWRVTIAPTLASRLAAGEGALHVALAGLGAVTVAVAPAALRNINTPRDVESVACPPMSIEEISVDELARLIEHDGAALCLVDVRESDEYHSGHVPGAVHVPLATVPDQLAAFQGQGAVHLICRSGGRSMRACEYLAGQGIATINVTGGTMAWTLTGRDVVMGERPS